MNGIKKGNNVVCIEFITNCNFSSCCKGTTTKDDLIKEGFHGKECNNAIRGQNFNP
jgi:hypothetical protein